MPSKVMTEIHPGEFVDMSQYGRTPDTAPTDMSHLQRARRKADESTAGGTDMTPKSVRPPRSRYFNSSSPDTD